MKYLLILFFFFTNHAFSEDTVSKYTLTSNGKVKIITEHKYSDKHYYKNYVIKEPLKIILVIMALMM